MPRDYRSFSAQEIVDIVSAVEKGTAKKDMMEAFDIGRSTIGTFVNKFSGSTLEEVEAVVRTWNKYKRIWRAIFEEKFAAAGRKVVDLPFGTDDIERTKRLLNLEGGNPYDLKYNVKGRGALPEEVQGTAPQGKEWRIKALEKGKYVFRLHDEGAGVFEPDPSAIAVKVPDAVPTIVERYARDDEQAVLARIRYNDLVSIFVGLTTYSLQSHWKTSIGSPVEIDEMYVGIDADGSHFVIPVEAKGREKSEKLTADQIVSNYIAASNQFPGIPVVSVAAKVMDDYRIAMIRFEVDPVAEAVERVFERHYILAVNPEDAKRPRPVLTDQEILNSAKAAKGLKGKPDKKG